MDYSCAMQGVLAAVVQCLGPYGRYCQHDVEGYGAILGRPNRTCNAAQHMLKPRYNNFSVSRACCMCCCVSGDEDVRWFSFDPSVHIPRPQMSCYLTRTTAETHKLIQDNLAETPVYGGWVDARGPRWVCGPHRLPPCNCHMSARLLYTAPSPLATCEVRIPAMASHSISHMLWSVFFTVEEDTCNQLSPPPPLGGVLCRYCPSIEDKIVRFADKDSHQIFLEPEGRNTPELYVQVGRSHWGEG
jgi:hypothetical protein